MGRSYIRKYPNPAQHNAEKIARRAAAMKKVHALLAGQELSAADIAAQLELNPSTVYGYLRQLEGEGYVCKTGFLDANERQTWAQDDAADKPDNDHATRARIVKAAQVGMPRDPFIAALFGPAPGAAA